MEQKTLMGMQEGLEKSGLPVRVCVVCVCAHTHAYVHAYICVCLYVVTQGASKPLHFESSTYTGPCSLFSWLQEQQIHNLMCQ